MATTLARRQAYWAALTALAALLLCLPAWCQQGEQTAPPAAEPPAELVQPGPFQPFSDRVLVDLAGTEEDWPAINEAFQTAAKSLPGTIEKLRYDKDRHTLAQAVVEGPRQRPGLVVIGGYRDFSDAEGAMISEYVRYGGALLVLVYGTDSSIPLVQSMNRLLAELGIAASYGRPEGKVVVHPHPITEGLTDITTAPRGMAIWAFSDWPLVTMKQYPVATAHVIGKGRVVVLDAGTLVRPRDVKSNKDDTSRGYRKLLSRALRWLTGDLTPQTGQPAGD